MKKSNLPIVIEKDSHGYFATCPALQGCYSQGETYEEVLENIDDAIKLHLEDIEKNTAIIRNNNNQSPPNTNLYDSPIQK